MCLVMLARQAAAAARNREGERLARANGGEKARAYAVPFICAISDTSPTSKLNVRFLQTCAIEPEHARCKREQKTAAYNCRSVGICAISAGRTPVRRFSPNSLPSHHQCESEAAQKTHREWDNVQIGDGWHRGNKGGEPARQRVSCDVSAAPRVANVVQRHNGEHWARMGVHEGVLRSGDRLAVVVKAAAQGSTLPLAGYGGDCLGTAMRLLLRVHVRAHR
jgi:hypothetical protein